MVRANRDHSHQQWILRQSGLAQDTPWATADAVVLRDVRFEIGHHSDGWALGCLERCSRIHGRAGAVPPEWTARVREEPALDELFGCHRLRFRKAERGPKPPPGGQRTWKVVQAFVLDDGGVVDSARRLLLGADGKAWVQDPVLLPADAAEAELLRRLLHVLVKRPEPGPPHRCPPDGA